MPDASEHQSVSPNPVGKLGYKIHLVSTGLLALLLVLVWVELASVRKQVSQVAEIDRKLQMVSQTVSDQSTLIGRALGVVIPVKVPDVVEVKFAAVEQVLLNEARWPTTADEVTQIAGDFAEVINTVPPWVQEELIPRIVPRRWELEALSLLRQEVPVELESRAELSDALLGHFSDRPEGVSEKLVVQLQARHGELESGLAELEREGALNYANAAISGNGDLNEALLRLANYGEADEEAGRLNDRLSDAILLRGTEADLTALEADLERLEDLKDESLRNYGLMRQQQALLDLKLRLVGWGKDYGSVAPQIARLEESLAALAKSSTTARADSEHEMTQRYQVWALQQVKAVPKFDALESAEKQKIGSMIDRNNPLSSARARAKSSAQNNLARHLIDNMAQIDQRLLDEAVAIWFRKVYQDRFDELDQDRQLRVVESFATARKRQLGAE